MVHHYILHHYIYSARALRYGKKARAATGNSDMAFESAFGVKRSDTGDARFQQRRASRLAILQRGTTAPEQDRSRRARALASTIQIYPAF